MKNPAAFYAALRSTLLGPTLSDSEVQGVNAILSAMEGAPVAYAAYALATAFLETGHTMQPVKEANWLSAEAAARYFKRMYDIEGARPAKARELGNLRPGDGARYPGRGYPQHTGFKNYETAEKLFGLPFTTQPDLMLQSDLAAKVMARFMIDGLYTGRKLADTLPSKTAADRPAFVRTRPVVNGTDRAGDIADYAMLFQSALIAGGWGRT